jgi:hypothetical protein
VPNAIKICLILLVTCTVTSEPVFVSDNPQSIYAADPDDSWNRIFRALFTRTLRARVSDAFPEGAPFESFQVRMGSFPIRLSKQKISRTEIGDRAIEPLYPTFFTAAGPAHVLSEPAYSELTNALLDAIDDTKNRSPIERALMQADVWAAYDIIYATTRWPRMNLPQRRTTLLILLRKFIRKLALTSDEIKSLKSNYLAAVSAQKLPNLFSAESGWLEIELLPHRLHDEATRFRRATRVFVKPRTTSSDPAQFVESLKYNQHLDQVEAVALIIQNLLIDTSGRVVPSPVFTDVQFRFFKNDSKNRTTTAEPQQFELSRRKLLTEPTSGGFVEYSATSPAYLAGAGNDYDFATPIDEAQAPIGVPLKTRCSQCHNPPLTTMLTYAIHGIPPVPTTRILKPLEQERAFYTSRRKEERDDFRTLIAAP